MLSFTIFFSFIDFFRRNKSECVLILSFFVLNIIYHTATTGGWHGLVGWGPRYLFLMIPFLLIPLGASLEQRKRWKILTIILVLAVISCIKFRKFQHLFLLGASYFFFILSSNVLVTLLIFSTLLDYYVAKAIFAAQTKKRKKILQMVLLIFNRPLTIL